MKTRIFNIQKFCIHDGTGLRTTVFFSGCPLSCKWCHNPEGKIGNLQILFHKEKCIGCGSCAEIGCKAQIFEPSRYIDREKCKVCGKCADLCPSKAIERSYYELTTDEIISVVMQDKAFYGKNGGITLSGGEPMFQPNAAIELLDAAKRNGINTAMETCGVFNKKYLPELIKVTDTFLWDYKDSDKKRLFENTGADLSDIEENIRYADSLGANIRLRCILIHGVNTDKKHAENIRKMAESLKNLNGIDIIKYHPMGQSKYEQLGIEDKFSSGDKIPNNDDLTCFNSILSKWI